jgi:hypothetical protein
MAKVKKSSKTAVLEAVPSDMREGPNTVNFNFMPGKEPDNLGALNLEEAVTVTVTGKVSRLSLEKNWGGSLELEISKFQIG